MEHLEKEKLFSFIYFILPIIIFAFGGILTLLNIQTEIVFKITLFLILGYSIYKYIYEYNIYEGLLLDTEERAKKRKIRNILFFTIVIAFSFIGNFIPITLFFYSLMFVYFIGLFLSTSSIEWFKEQKRLHH